jgi:hypothetical protein
LTKPASVKFTMENMPFKDVRLKNQVADFYAVDKSLIAGLSRLSEKTRIKFTCKDDDIGSYAFNSRIRGKKIYEIMNSICLIRNFSWNKRDRGFELDDSLNEYDRVFQPKNEFRKNRNELSIPIMDMMDDLNGERLRQIESTQGVPIQSLPSDIQNKIMKIIDSINDEDIYKDGSTISKNKSDMRIQMDRKKSPGFRNYMIFIKTPEGTYGTGINDYTRWKSKLMDKSSASHYENTKKPLKKVQWAESSLSKTRISFTGYASPAEILIDIAARSEFNFLCDRKKFWKQSRRLNYRDLTIPELLESIERDFPDTKCDISGDEIVIVQAPLNPWRIYSASREQ